MLAVELVAGAGDKTPEPRPGRPGELPTATPQGLVTLTAGTYGNVLRFLPPLSIGDDLLHEGLDILESRPRPNRSS